MKDDVVILSGGFIFQNFILFFRRTVATKEVKQETLEVKKDR